MELDFSCSGLWESSPCRMAATGPTLAIHAYTREDGGRSPMHGPHQVLISCVAGVTRTGQGGQGVSIGGRFCWLARVRSRSLG